MLKSYCISLAWPHCRSRCCLRTWHPQVFVWSLCRMEKVQRSRPVTRFRRWRRCRFAGEEGACLFFAACSHKLGLPEEQISFLRSVCQPISVLFPQHLCFGYPFFLSLSDVAVMLDLVNFRPSVPQTDCCCCCYFFCRLCHQKGKEKRRKRTISEKLKAQRQEKNTPAHFQKSQKNLKTHNQLQNLLKIS